MIKFSIAKEDLKYLMNSLKDAVAKSNSKPVHECILFEGKGGMLYAYAVDGCRLHSVCVPVVQENIVDFRFVIRPFLVMPTKAEFITCELGDDTATFDAGEWNCIRALEKGEFLDVHEALSHDGPPVLRIGVNPKYLMDALKGYSGADGHRNPLVLEFWGPLSPFIVRREHNKDDLRMVLPVRLKSE